MEPNIRNALLDLVSTLFQLVLWLFLLRVILQAVRADFYHPVSQFTWKFTQPLVKPLGKVILKWRRIDFAGIVVAFLIALLYVEIYAMILGRSVPLEVASWFALRETIGATLNLFTFSIVVQAILSWLGPGVANPAGSILWSINEPILRPMRRILPPFSGVDLSPLPVILILQFLSRLISVGMLA